MTQIVFFGECMLEGEPCGLFSYGGDTLNSAVYLRRVSANNINVAYATALGTDDDSQRLLNAWCHEGLDTQLVTRLSDKSPAAIKSNLIPMANASLATSVPIALPPLILTKPIPLLSSACAATRLTTFT